MTMEFLKLHLETKNKHAILDGSRQEAKEEKEYYLLNHKGLII